MHFAVTPWNGTSSVISRDAEEEVPKRFDPILRWVGGKRKHLKILLSLFPPSRELSGRKYFEPFLGSAAVFLAAHGSDFFLSDGNPELVNFYRCLQRDPKRVYKEFLYFCRRNSETKYYRIRSDFNEERPSYRKAAMFWYLNTFSYNGVHRVNSKGVYNVPFGGKAKKSLVSQSLLDGFVSKISNATIECLHYKNALDRVGRKSFVFLDPPYPPRNHSAFFAHYTEDRFAHSDQVDLAKSFKDLDEKGALLMMTNSDNRTIRNLYSKFNIVSFVAPRYVSCKTTKVRQRELIITNYKLRHNAH